VKSIVHIRLDDEEFLTSLESQIQAAVRSILSNILEMGSRDADGNLQLPASVVSAIEEHAAGTAKVPDYEWTLSQLLSRKLRAAIAGHDLPSIEEEHYYSYSLHMQIANTRQYFTPEKAAAICALWNNEVSWEEIVDRHRGFQRMQKGDNTWSWWTTGVSHYMQQDKANNYRQSTSYADTPMAPGKAL
jgi:hypothetical protein